MEDIINDYHRFLDVSSKIFAFELPLAMAYQADGQVKKAVELLEHVVAVNTRDSLEHQESNLRLISLAMSFVSEDPYCNV
jgi:hypothetical protein